jgi:hypothetical protein
VDYINANASTVTITDSSDTGDLASLAVTTHGATTLTTTDDDAAAAHFTVDADGNITLDAATGIVTIEDGGTEVLRFTESCSGDVTIKLVTNAKDLIFTDNGDAEGFRILDAAAGVNVAGLLTAGSLDIDNVLINGTTIGHTCDTDLLTLGNATLLAKGTVTVGVCGTGHDVKLFGCAAGAYMEWDESANLLEVRGATAAGPGHLKLTTGEATVVACDVLGKIEFQAPAETGADALRISASIAAVAQATFDATNNATDLVFYTGHSEDAAEKFRFTSQNEIGIAGANYGTDGQVLTSGGAGAAVAWEDAGGGGVVSGGTNNAILRADGTGGSTSQGSGVIIADCNDVTIPKGGASATGASLAIETYNDGGNPARLRLRTSKHDTQGTHGAMTANLPLGYIQFEGSDGDSFERSSVISAWPTQTWSGSAQGSRLEFYTTADCATCETNRITIEQCGNVKVETGNVIIGTAGKGIDFSNQACPAGAMTSELLDHYEEGTWEPGIGDSGTLNATSESQGYHGANQGSYVRIGNTVFVHGRLIMNNKGTMTCANTAHLLGLPFASSSANYSSINISQSTAGGSAGMSITAGQYVSGGIGTCASQADLHKWDATVGTTGLLISEINLPDFYISGQYLV